MKISETAPFFLKQPHLFYQPHYFYGKDVNPPHFFRGGEGGFQLVD